MPAHIHVDQALVRSWRHAHESAAYLVLACASNALLIVVGVSMAARHDLPGLLRGLGAAVALLTGTGIVVYATILHRVRRDR